MEVNIYNFSFNGLFCWSSGTISQPWVQENWYTAHVFSNTLPIKHLFFQKSLLFQLFVVRSTLHTTWMIIVEERMNNGNLTHSREPRFAISRLSYSISVLLQMLVDNFGSVTSVNDWFTKSLLQDNHRNSTKFFSWQNNFESYKINGCYAI